MSAAVIIAILVVAIVSYVIFNRKRSARLRKEIEARNIPYAKQASFAYVLFFRKRLELLQMEVIKKTGKVYGFDLASSVTIVVGVPELIQVVLSKEFQKFPNRRKFESNDPFFANALSTVELDQWKRLRAIVAPTFATGKLKRMKPCLDDICRSLIKNIDNHLAQTPDGIGNIKNFAGAFTMDTVIQVAFATKVDSLIDPNNVIIKNAKKMFGSDISYKNMIYFALVFFGPKFVQKFFRNLRFNGDVVDFFRDFSIGIIEKKRKEFAQKDFTKASTFLEFLLEAEHEYEQQLKQQQQQSNGKSNGHQTTVMDEEKKPVKYMTNNEMIAQCVLFLAAGYDTTATTITMACYYLALNPDKQQLAYENVCKMMAEHVPDPDSPIEAQSDSLESMPFDFFNKLDYINGVVNETLRMTPPAPFLERRCMEDTTLATEDGKYKIFVKKDDIIQIPSYCLHYDPEHFPEPEQFRPERFLPENVNSFHKYAYLPFGSGPRACVAKSLALMEAKMALAWLVKHYKFAKCDQTPIPVEFYNQGGLLSPKNIFIKIQRR